MGFYSGKNILVAGAGGICGHAIVKRLLDEGANVRASIHTQRTYDIAHPRLRVSTFDFMNFNECVDAVKDMDIVINSVAYVRGAQAQSNSPMPIIRNNVSPGINLAEASCVEGVDLFGVIGSSVMYPDVSYPVKESEAFDSMPSLSYRGIGWVKRYLEQVYMYFHSISKTKFAMTRTTALYGPHDAFDIEKNHVIPDMIMRADRRDNPFVIWGDGSQTRDFVYIEDLVDGLLLTMEKHPHADPINIASGRATTIKELVETITRLSGYTPKFVYDTTKPTQIPTRLVDVTKAKEILGWQAKYNLETGLKNTIEWYNSTKG